MKTISYQGVALIKRFEGFSANPYFCPAGLPTIGYGHVIKPGEHYPEGGITLEMAKSILKQDVSIFEAAINRLVTAEINQNQFDALVSFAYNIGIKVFEKSTLLKFLNQNEHQKAAKELGKWVFSRGVRLPGLIRRRRAEADLFSSLGDFTEL